MAATAIPSPESDSTPAQIEVQDAQLNVRAAEGNLARARRDLRVATVNLGWVRGAL